MSMNDAICPPKAAFYTLGCKVNTFDTEAIIELFEKAGYIVVDFEEKADVYVINTCTVTHLGDRKSRNMLRRAGRRNPDAVIVATGCYAQVAPEEITAIPEVDLVIGTQDRLKIVALTENVRREKAKKCIVRNNDHSRVFESLRISDSHEHTRAFIKVQEGCDRFCSYCIIPYARGRARSRPIPEILEEVSRLTEKGFQEFVLTGIHLASYGKDFDDGTDMITMIQKVASLPNVKRIRLGSLEPLSMTEEAVAALAAIEQFCPHFHLSLQSGSDTVLQRMKRRYTTAQYLEVVRRIRRYFTLPAITTDIMTGFPGETEEEFDKTMQFAKKVGFYQIHVFKYSRRKGTPAAEMPDQVDEQIKNSRSEGLIRLNEDLQNAFLSKNDGLFYPVLFEQSCGKGQIEGYTPNYIPVKMPGNEKKCGKIIDVALSYDQKDRIMGCTPV